MNLPTPRRQNGKSQEFLEQVINALTLEPYQKNMLKAFLDRRRKVSTVKLTRQNTPISYGTKPRVVIVDEFATAQKANNERE